MFDHIASIFKLDLHEQMLCVSEGHMCFLRLCKEPVCFSGRFLRKAVAAAAHHSRVGDLRFLLSKLKGPAELERLEIVPPGTAVRILESSVENLLLQEGVRVNDQRPLKSPLNTPLGLAVRAGHVSVVSLFLQHGVDITRQYEIGCGSLLAYAAHLGKYEIVQILLDHGADVFIANDQGKQACDEAIICGHSDVAKLIREALLPQVRRGCP